MALRFDATGLRVHWYAGMADIAAGSGVIDSVIKRMHHSLASGLSSQSRYFAKASDLSSGTQRHEFLGMII